MWEINENMRSSASFPDFTRPKTALQLGTEHGLTSEFGTGSGGTRALWPASIQSISQTLIYFGHRVTKYIYQTD